MQTTNVQLCARRKPFCWALALICGAAMISAVPARAEDGDVIVQRDVTPRIAYRSVPTDALPVRTAVSPFPTRAFDQSIGSLVSVVSDSELSGSHASPSYPFTGARAPIPSQVGALQPSGTALGASVAAGGASVGGIGGQVVQATAGVASLVSGALMPLSRASQP